MVPRERIRRIRNFGVIAHVDAGKTTLTERILHATGRIHTLGSVDGGTTVTDYDPRERDRGITIGAAAVNAVHRNHLLTLVDTPGHVDFQIEVERSLRVLDGAVVVLDAVAGVEAQTESVWAQADRFGVPRIAFINKIDRAGADFEQTLASIVRAFDVAAVPLVIPSPVAGRLLDVVHEQAIILGSASKDSAVPLEQGEGALLRPYRERLLELVSEVAPELLEAYLADEVIEPAALLSALRSVVLRKREQRIVPVLCGSAKVGLGVDTLLDAVVALLPSPLEATSPEGVDAEATALVAYAFKGLHDDHGQRVFVRVYSGVLTKGMTVRLARSQRTARVGRLVRLLGNQVEDVDRAVAGEIVAILGAPLPTGETLLSEAGGPALEGLLVPEPVVRVALMPMDNGSRSRLGPALGRLIADDPSLSLSGDSETGETVLGGLGELHLEVSLAKLADQSGVKLRVSPPKVAYRETITQAARGECKFVRQKGGPGQYGHVELLVEPGATASGFTFVDASVGGVVPKEFVPSIEAGAKEAAALGALAGYPLVDLRVTLLGGSFHEQDSNELAFATAARLAFAEAVKAAGAIYLEPIMLVEVVTPESCLGEVLGDLGRRRGRVSALGRRATMHTVSARVPLSELMGYANALRSQSEGRASFAMKLAGHEPVPAVVAHKVPQP
jgi:elongation factor G